MKKLITIILILFMPVWLSAAEWNSHIDIREAENWDLIGHQVIPNSQFVEVTLAEENVKVVQVYVDILKSGVKPYIVGYRYIFGEELYIWVEESGEFIRIFDGKEREKAIKNLLKLYIKKIGGISDI